MGWKGLCNSLALHHPIRGVETNALARTGNVFLWRDIRRLWKVWHSVINRINGRDLEMFSDLIQLTEERQEPARHNDSLVFLEIMLMAGDGEGTQPARKLAYAILNNT